MADKREPQSTEGIGIVGVAAFGLLAVGLASAFFGGIAILEGKTEGAGLMFIASALSFGMTLNCLLRK